MWTLTGMALHIIGHETGNMNSKWIKNYKGGTAVQLYKANILQKYFA